MSGATYTPPPNCDCDEVTTDVGTFTTCEIGGGPCPSEAEYHAAMEEQHRFAIDTEIQEATQALQARLEVAEGLLAEWIEGAGDRCRYDHNDLCQAHNLDHRPCPIERAQVLLSKEKESQTCDFCGQGKGEHSKRCSVVKYGVSPKPPYTQPKDSGRVT